MQEFPHKEYRYNAHRQELFSKTYCELLEKELKNKQVITRQRLYHLAWNGAALPWMQYDGFELGGDAIDHYFTRLNMITLPTCEVLKNHFHLIFDNAHAGDDTIVRQHQKMLELLIKLHDLQKNDGTHFASDDKLKILTFQSYLKEFDPLLIFSLDHRHTDEYEITYYFFNPDGPKYAFNDINRIMSIKFSTSGNQISQFTPDYDFPRFHWLKKYALRLKRHIEPIAPAPQLRE